MRTKSDPEFFHLIKCGPANSVTPACIGRAELLAWAANERPDEDAVAVVGSDGVRYRLREVWELERVDAPEQKPTPSGKKRGRKSKAEKEAEEKTEPANAKPRVSIRDTNGKPISGSGEAVS